MWSRWDSRAPLLEGQTQNHFAENVQLPPKRPGGLPTAPQLPLGGPSWTPSRPGPAPGSPHPVQSQQAQSVCSRLCLRKDV